MRSQMFLPKGDEENEGIISKEEPIGYDENKKVVLFRGIKEEEYSEISDFLNQHNRMSSGNFTLLPKDEISRLVRLGSLNILMRGINKSTLIGTIFSIPFPIRCKFNSVTEDDSVTEDESKSEESQIVEHCCTSFLTVHQKLRNKGLCMALMREMTKYGHSKEIYCAYSLTSFPLTPKSLEIRSWYRPINLPRSIGLGFSFLNWNNPGEFMKNKLLYTTKLPRKYVCIKVDKKLEKALEFYKKITCDKKFLFLPELEFFKKWSQEFPTFLVSFEKKPIGIFSFTTIYCRMITGLEGKLLLPLIFNSVPEHSTNLMKCLLNIGAEYDYDTLYTHCIGDINQGLLKTINAIQTKDKSYFSLYNNSMNLDIKDLYIPIF